MRTINHASPGTGKPSRHCDNCGKPLGQLPASAVGKRFCCNSCRNAWHSARRKLAWEEYLRTQRSARLEEGSE